MTSYSFVFPPVGLEVIASSGDMHNIIYAVNYRIAAIDENHQVYKSMKTVLPPPSVANFINYEEIAKETLAGWIEEVEPTLSDAKAELADRLQELASTPATILMPLPWEVQ